MTICPDVPIIGPASSLHEPALAVIRASALEDRSSENPLSQAASRRLTAMDLPAAYLWYLVQPSSLKPFSEYVDAQPGFWTLDYQWTDRAMPLWLPGFVNFLSRLPGWENALVTLGREFENLDSSGWLGQRFSSRSAMYLFFALLKHGHGSIRKYVDKLLGKSPAQEIGVAAVGDEKSMALRALMVEWSYRPLLFGATCGLGSASHLAKMGKALESSEPGVKASGHAMPNALEEFVKNGLPLAFYVDDAAQKVLGGNNDPIVRIMMAVNVVDVSMILSRKAISFTSPFPLRVPESTVSEILLAACVHKEPNCGLPRINEHLLLQSQEWYETVPRVLSPLQRQEVDQPTIAVRANYKAKQEEHFKIRLQVNKKEKRWRIEIKNLYTWSCLNAKRKHKNLTVFFDALRTASWDGNCGKVDIKLILARNWEKNRKAALKAASRQLSRDLTSEKYDDLPIKDRELLRRDLERITGKQTATEVGMIMKQMSRAVALLHETSRSKEVEHWLSSLYRESRGAILTNIDPELILWTDE